MKLLGTKLLSLSALFAVCAAFAPEASARPACYRSKDCVSKMGKQDQHNCFGKGKAGKSWRADDTTVPPSACINK